MLTPGWSLFISVYTLYCVQDTYGQLLDVVSFATQATSLAWPKVCAICCPKSDTSFKCLLNTETAAEYGNTIAAKNDELIAKMLTEEGRVCKEIEQRGTGDWKMSCKYHDGTNPQYPLDEKNDEVRNGLPQCDGIALEDITWTTSSSTLTWTTVPSTTEPSTSDSTSTTVSEDEDDDDDDTTTEGTSAVTPDDLSQQSSSGSYEPVAWMIVGIGVIAFLVGVAVLVRSLNAAPATPPINAPNQVRQEPRTPLVRQEPSAVEFENFGRYDSGQQGGFPPGGSPSEQGGFQPGGFPSQQGGPGGFPSQQGGFGFPSQQGY